MPTNTPPFEVICVKNNTEAFGADGNPAEKSAFLILNQRYKVVAIERWRKEDMYILAEFGENELFSPGLFRRIPPYQNSVSKELAEKAMTNPIEVDQPIKIKEVQNAV